MIIALCGRPQVGKSKVSSFLTEEMCFNLLDTKDILRKITSEITGCSYSSLLTGKGKVEKYEGKSHREIMGELGLTLESLFGEDYLLRRALEGIDPNKDYVIDALRKNQALSPALKNAFVVEVVKSGPYANEFAFDLYDKSRIDFRLKNDAGLSALYGDVDKMLGHFYGLNDCR